MLENIQVYLTVSFILRTWYCLIYFLGCKCNRIISPDLTVVPPQISTNPLLPFVHTAPEFDQLDPVDCELSTIDPHPYLKLTIFRPF